MDINTNTIKIHHSYNTVHSQLELRIADLVDTGPSSESMLKVVVSPLDSLAVTVIEGIVVVLLVPVLLVTSPLVVIE